MKKLTPQQRCIRNFLADGSKKKAIIVAKYKHWYYHNADKYIGEILSRMVKANIINREAHGVYGLTKRTVTQSLEESNQISLFKNSITT